MPFVSPCYLLSALAGNRYLAFTVRRPNGIIATNCAAPASEETRMFFVRFVQLRRRNAHAQLYFCAHIDIGCPGVQIRTAWARSRTSPVPPQIPAMPRTMLQAKLETSYCLRVRKSRRMGRETRTPIPGRPMPREIWWGIRDRSLSRMVRRRIAPPTLLRIPQPTVAPMRHRLTPEVLEGRAEMSLFFSTTRILRATASTSTPRLARLPWPRCMSILRSRVRRFQGRPMRNRSTLLAAAAIQILSSWPQSRTTRMPSTPRKAEKRFGTRRLAHPYRSPVWPLFATGAGTSIRSA